MQVVADVDEADIGGVIEGQRASFTVDAYPNDVFEGVVTQIRLGDASSTSSTSTTTTVVTYEVVISAPNPDLKLKPRLTANVTIYIPVSYTHLHGQGRRQPIQELHSKCWSVHPIRASHFPND